MVFKKIATAIALSSLVSVFFLFSGVAYASETLIEQTVGCTIFSSSPNFKLGQTFTLDAPATIEEIQAEHYSQTYDNLVLEIWTASSTTGKPTGSVAIASTTFGAFGPVDAVCNNDWHSFVLDTPLDLEAGFYAFVFDDYDNAKGIKLYYKGSEGYVDGTEVEDNNDEGATWDIQPTFDLKFKIIGTPAPSDTIEILYPTSTTTPPYDFSEWTVGFEMATSTTATSTHYYIHQIYTGITSSTITDLAGGRVFYYDDTSPYDITNQRIFSGGTTYYAEAEMRYFVDIYDTYGQVVATSDIVSFTTSQQTEEEWGFYPAPTSTATSSAWSFTCDPESGAFANSLCNLFRFLFMPSQKSIENFSNLNDTVSSKPPFGYFGEIRDAFLDIDASSTPAFAFSGMDTLSENSAFVAIKTTITAILWLALTFWILRRITQFDFHV